MSLMEIEVLSSETNRSVVRMPGRKYPGVVVQSDKLIWLNGSAARLHEAANATGDKAMISESSNLAYEISELLKILYEASTDTEISELD